MNGHHHHLLSILIDRNKTRPETKDKMLTVPVKTITRATMANLSQARSNILPKIFLTGCTLPAVAALCIGKLLITVMSVLFAVKIV